MTPVQTGFCRSMLVKAALKSATTPAPTGATIEPVITQGPTLVIPPAKLVPTFPLMTVPGPVSVPVTVPIVGIAVSPTPVKAPDVPRLGATGAHAGIHASRSAPSPSLAVFMAWPLCAWSAFTSECTQANPRCLCDTEHTYKPLAGRCRLCVAAHRPDLRRTA